MYEVSVPTCISVPIVILHPVSGSRSGSFSYPYVTFPDPSFLVFQTPI